jgi:hypothetical protein
LEPVSSPPGEGWNEKGKGTERGMRVHSKQAVKRRMIWIKINWLK